MLLRHNVSGIFRHIHKVTYIEAYSPTLEFRHIQDPGINFSNSVKLHFLFMTGSSFKSLFGSIWNIFDFCFKSNCLTFFLQDSISVITTVIIACHPR